MPKQQLVLIIDPPASQYSEPARIRAWSARLEEMAIEYEGTGPAEETVRMALKEAEDWLDWSTRQRAGLE
jgi:hypothetical protein